MAEEEKALNAGCSEIKEIDDDSESNKAGPSNAEEGKAPNAGYSEIKEVDDDSESNKASPNKAEASSDSEPEPAPAQGCKITSVVPRPDDWKAQREMEENMTEEERLRMQGIWKKNQATQEEGASSKQDKPQKTKGKGQLVGLESTLEQRSCGFPVAPAAPGTLVLRHPIIPVIKPSDYEAIQNRNEELSDDARASAMQQIGPFPVPHPVDSTCACWDCVQFLPGKRD